MVLKYLKSSTKCHDSVGLRLGACLPALTKKSNVDTARKLCQLNVRLSSWNVAHLVLVLTWSWRLAPQIDCKHVVCIWALENSVITSVPWAVSRNSFRFSSSRTLSSSKNTLRLFAQLSGCQELQPTKQLPVCVEPLEWGPNATSYKYFSKMMG